MIGANAAAETLKNLGVSVVFSVSGNQILPLYDSLSGAGIKIVHARHETAAAYMAEAWGQLRGEPGVCLVTAGPGITSALTGIANAKASETPLLVLSGAAPLTQRHLGAFQEMDQVTTAKPLCKLAVEVTAASELCSALEAAWNLALCHVPGPVYLSLPVDVLEANVKSETKAIDWGYRETQSLAIGVLRKRAKAIANAMIDARRAVVLARPSLAREQSGHLLERLNRRIPTLIVESPRGLKDPAWGERLDYLRAADIVLFLAPTDFAVGFGRVGNAGARTIRVGTYDEPSSLPPNDLDLQVPEPDFLEEFLPLIERALPQIPALPITAARPEALTTEQLHPLDVVHELRSELRPDDLIVIDGGEFGQWVRAGLRSLPNRQLINGKLGAIGSAIPHAVGAALADRTRRVFVFLGDGAFSYYSAEIDTAIREQLAFTVIIGNDSCYGAEWHSQFRRYGPSRTFATALEDRPYQFVAMGYGADGKEARSRTELRTAIQSAISAQNATVTCINVHIASVPSPAIGDP